MKRFITIFIIISVIALPGCGRTSAAETEDITAAVQTKEPDSDEPADEEKQVKEETDKAAEKAVPDDRSLDLETYDDAAAKTDNSGKDEEKPADGSDTASVASEKDTLPEYTVTSFSEVKLMYASNPVNVRKGPSTAYERVGGLSRAQEVTVSGKADTGWYELIYGGNTAYVSDKYLQEEKPVEMPVPEQAQAAGVQGQQVQAVTEVKNVAGVILVGDSRFVQMQANVGENSCTWIAESGKGYNWLNENAIARVDGCVGKGSKILINLGVNDPGNLNNYLTLVNAKAAEWAGKGAKVYYASVNPVWDNPYVTEEQVEYFNSQMISGLSGDIQWIDSHSYLDSIGYKLVDGLHFNPETYQNLYAYFMSCL